MRKGLLIIALGLSLTPGLATADVLLMPEGEPTPEITLPAKGSTMAQVERQFGEPRHKRPTVGGDSPKQPPITRWDYDGFAVIFERDKVVDAVVPGAPPPVFNKDELQPVAGTPPTPGFAADEAPMTAPDAMDEVPDEPAPPAEPEVPEEPPARKVSPAPREAPAEGVPTPR
jgi:hypothetical protein